MKGDLAVVWSHWILMYIEDKVDEIFLMPSSASLSTHIVIKVRVGWQASRVSRVWER